MQSDWIMVAVVALAGGPSFAGSPLAAPGDTGQVERGAAIYGEACASCHGAQLEGQPNWRSPNPDGTLPAPPHDAEGHTWHHSDKLLFRYVKLGGKEVFKDIPGVKSAMPGFSETLSDDDIWNVLAFIKSHWPEQARAYQEAVTANDK